MRVAVHCEPGSRRSAHIARAMWEGIRAAGDEAELIGSLAPQFPLADALVSYGWGRPSLFETYQAAGKPYVYIDLGWWDRKPVAAPLDGFHKVIVNCREPALVSAYLRRPSPPDRMQRLGLQVLPWRRDGGAILLAGMSARCANTYGLAPEQWEREAFESLQRVRWPGDRVPPIIYRPKPSWTGWTRIDGAEISLTEGLDRPFGLTHAVVTHHSNVAIDALLVGIPVSVDRGAATPFSTPMARLWNPLRPEGREQLIADLAYLQWTTAEMRSGACWRHLRSETELT